jgi:hypothetical protein
VADCSHFGHPGGKKEWFAAHKEDGMVNLVSSTPLLLTTRMAKVGLNIAVGM